MSEPILYSFIRCPYAIRARSAIKLINFKCVLREIRLNNKPEHMLKASPKGTVPVLILKDQIIDESIDIINWALDQKNVFEGNLSKEYLELTENIIKHFDNDFKYHLDRYKYANRYQEVDSKLHQKKCLNILSDLEKIISDKNWIFGKKLNKLDISILPFIRQFRIANPDWFDSQKNIRKIQKVLHNYMKSELFNDVMFKFDVWEEGSEKVYFPVT